MRRFAFLGAVTALLFSGAVVLAAASPSPSPTATAHPTATSGTSVTPLPSSAPKASASPAPAAATTTEPTFSAQIQPLQIGGSASVAELQGGGATVTLKISGLLDAQRWTVDIDGGTVARPNERVEIAFKSGADVTRQATDTVQIHLTKTEMRAFLTAQKAGGVVAIVSDGMRQGFAEFSAA